MNIKMLEDIYKEMQNKIKQLADDAINTVVTDEVLGDADERMKVCSMCMCMYSNVFVHIRIFLCECHMHIS